jgi:N-hydroxyarylamine O-acetyltransferase
MNDKQLARYLERIGHGWNVKPDLETLRSLHRAHVAAIPFENLDVQFGLVPSIEFEPIYEKLVERRRGGWCFEMNGLFGAALEAIGFDVVRLACGVMRQVGGDEKIGGHLALLVKLDTPWLVDVGFGGSLLHPLPLAAGGRDETPFTVSLEETDDGYWRFTESAGSAPYSFDFRLDPAEQALLAAKCHFIATDPASNFVLNFVAQKRLPSRHIALRGRVLTERGPDGTTMHTLADADEFVATLAERFGIEEPRARELWPRVVARHTELFETAA